MRDLAVLFVHRIATLARLLGRGGARSVVAESLLLKHQLLILNRSRTRAPNLRPSDRVIAGLCAGSMRPCRLLRSAIVLQPSTIMAFHRALVKRKYRLLFSPQRRGKRGPKGPAPELITAIVEMKRRNPRFGCRRIAQQLSFIFGVEIDKDVVRRVLARHYRPEPASQGPSWLTFLGHSKDSLEFLADSARFANGLLMPVAGARGYGRLLQGATHCVSAHERAMQVCGSLQFDSALGKVALERSQPVLELVGVQGCMALGLETAGCRIPHPTAERILGCVFHDQQVSLVVALVRLGR